MDLGFLLKSLITNVWHLMSRSINFSFFGVSFSLSLVYIEIGILIISLSLFLVFKIIK